MTVFIFNRLLKAALASVLLGMLLLVGCGGTTPTKPKPKAEAKPVVEEAPVQALTSLSEAQSLLYQKSLGLMRQEKYSQAEDTLKKLVKRYPGIPELVINLSMCYYHQGDTEQAERTLLTVASAIDDHAVGQNLAGLLAISRGGFSEAETAFKQAIKNKDNYANAHYNLALLYDKYWQDVPKAIEHYERYVAIEKNDDTTIAWLRHLKSLVEAR